MLFLKHLMAKKEIIPNFWSVYWAINKHRFSQSHTFIDADSGEELEYSFTGMHRVRQSLFLSLFSAVLWISPALLIVFLSAVFAFYSLWFFALGVVCVTLYHFAGMYYCIR